MKIWAKRGVNKLFKKLRNTGTVNWRPGSGRPRSARTKENAKLLLQKFPQYATYFVLPIVRWSDRELLFVRKENKVSGILRELLKHKLSVLHASSAVLVCQLLCMAPLETFQMQVVSNNLAHRRPMNARLPWYLTDSPVGLRLVLLLGIGPHSSCSSSTLIHAFSKQLSSLSVHKYTQLDKKNF